jgi:DNA repair protein RAD5
MHSIITFSRPLPEVTQLLDHVIAQMIDAYLKHERPAKIVPQLSGRGSSARRGQRDRGETSTQMSVSASSDPRLPPKEPDLFFPSSDSEEEDEVPAVPLASSTVFGASSCSSTILKRNGHRSSPRRSGSSPSNGDTKDILGSQGSDIVPLDSTPLLFTSDTAGPSTSKRRALSRSPSNNVPLSSTDGYLGEFVCEGWSLSKGKGYCVPGSKVIFERPKAAKGGDEDSKVLARGKDKVGPARLVNGKMVNAKTKPVGGKQVTLGSLGLGKKAASVVRLVEQWW